MEKISGILKPSHRVTSVDMSDAAPARPGMPSFGRPEGSSSLRERGVDGLAGGAEAQATMMHWRAREGRNTRDAEAIADRFFMSKEQEVMKPISKQAPDRTSFGESEVEREPASEEMMPKENPLHSEDPIPGEFYPKGSFLNAVA